MFNGGGGGTGTPNDNNNFHRRKGVVPPSSPGTGSAPETFDPYSEVTQEGNVPLTTPLSACVGGPRSPVPETSPVGKQSEAALFSNSPGLSPADTSRQTSSAQRSLKKASGARAPVVAEDEEEQADPIKLEEGLEEQEFFHGLLPRDDVLSLLRQDGDFVVRVTEVKEKGKKPVREICLSVSWKTQVHHFLLRPNAAKRYLICNPGPNEPYRDFESVSELVSFYLKRAQPFSHNRIVISNPVPQQEWELHHNQITYTTKLGAGAFGAVYAGELRRKNKRPAKVAIKMLKGDKVDKKKIEEIMHEARIMRPLKHRHVVRCHGIAADTEPLMILMELVNGGALDFFLRTHTNKVSLAMRLSMALDAALGLEYVHSKNILHRDVAARNCLFDCRVVKISDFGLSVLGDQHVMTATEKAPVRWLAPEVFRTHLYTQTADVWAYSVLVWEIFNDGREPYQGYTGAQIRDTVLQHGNGLHLPAWAGSNLQKLEADMFAVDPSTRLTMSQIVKRLTVLAPKRDGDDEDSEGEEGRRKRRSVGSNSWSPFRFFDKSAPKPEANNETDSDRDRGGHRGGGGAAGAKFKASTKKSNSSKESSRSLKSKAPSREPLRTFFGFGGGTGKSLQRPSGSRTSADPNKGSRAGDESVRRKRAADSLKVQRGSKNANPVAIPVRQHASQTKAPRTKKTNRRPPESSSDRESNR